MTHPTLLLLVRFRTSLSEAEIMETARARADEFRALQGLIQKYYVFEPATGDYGGFYLWQSAEALEAYKQSELRASIAAAYQVEGEPRLDVLQVMMPLRET